MQKIQKLTIGIRPATKIFRLPSLVGLIIDSILDERGSHTLEKEYFTNVHTNYEQSFFVMRNAELGNYLNMGENNISLTKDVYETDKIFNLKKFIQEFSVIWDIVNGYLKLHDIRRIGMVAEHRFLIEKTNPNKVLIEAITSFESPKFPAKFLFRYEERRPTIESIAPDIKKDDFINIIYDYYDSERDADHPAPGALNCNLDVQRYYSPLVSSNVLDETKKLEKIFLNEKKVFDAFLIERGIAS